MSWQLIECEGKLAITLGWSEYNDKPIATRSVWVHPSEKWDKEYYSQFTQIRLIENSVFACFSNITYTEKMLYTTDWKQVYQEQPIKPPGRGGKDWDWDWSSWSHKWVKKYR